MRILFLLLLVSTVAGCHESHPAGSPPARFAAVTRKQAATTASRFCDKSWPAHDASAPRYHPPPTRPLPGLPPAPAVKGWRWVNAWATWCGPCVGEMALLKRWGKALRRDGHPVTFEEVSVDSPDAQAKLQKWVSHRRLPGRLLWLRSQKDLGPWMQSLGLDKDASIPIHALVDPSGQLRCVRTGAVHEEDYGQVRAFLSAT